MWVTWGREIERMGQEQRDRHPPKASRGHIGAFVATVLAVLLALGLWHVYENYQSKDNPPASCQLLGGHWDIWNGWQCG